MPKHLVIINTQSFGDILLSTHIARVAEKYVPDLKIHLAVRSDLTLTTAEKDKNALADVLYILYLQHNIHSTGVVHLNQYYPVFYKDQSLENPEFLIIKGWSSDLGILKSQLKPFYDKYNIKEDMDTETKFYFGGPPKSTDNLTIGIAGNLDFLRKWGNEEEFNFFLAQINNSCYNKIEFGVDSSPEPYSQQLIKLTQCDLLISPMGSLIHAAAGLGIDTISLTSVFPAIYDCPEYYHSGWHRSCKPTSPLHCINYKCVSTKLYDNQEAWGNPATTHGFWPKDCQYTANGKSCNYNVKANDILHHFEDWIKYKNENS